MGDLLVVVAIVLGGGRWAWWLVLSLRRSTSCDFVCDSSSRFLSCLFPAGRGRIVSMPCEAVPVCVCHMVAPALLRTNANDGDVQETLSALARRL